MMSKVKERAEKLIRELPDEVVQELLEDLEDALALAKAKEEDTGVRRPLEEVLQRLRGEGRL
ncbi:MAG: hypothetical protein ACUVUT_04580 [Candidatus Bipolaricaulia bacterium]